MDCIAGIIAGFNGHSPREVSAELLKVGVETLPIPAGQKGPGGSRLKDWQNRTFGPEDFLDGDGIGIRNSSLQTIDRDCPEALHPAILGRFTSRTLRSGRASTPEAHSWYRVDGKIKKYTFKDADGTVMLELRVGKGHQTLIPPTINPEHNEPYVWHNPEVEPAEVSPEEIVRGASLEAAACLIVRHYPPEGGQYDFGLYLAGFLIRNGIDEDTAYDLMAAAYEAAGYYLDHEAEKNIRGVCRTTAEKHEDEEEYAGGPSLEEHYPAFPLKKLRKIIKLAVDILQEEEEDTEAARMERAEKAWETCQNLARHKDITSDFAATLHSRGVAGESNQIRILYLTLTSRFLNKMVNIAVKGPSSSGKSYLVEQVVEAFPESAYYALTSMSEKALIYLNEDMRHRFLIIYEASGLAGDMQTYLIRTLLSEGRIDYQTVEATKDGIKPRHLTLEGPTGLIVTTTQTRMHPENETRLFSLNMTDSKEQTADILMALADEDRAPVSMDEWRALQTWLEGQSNEVTIHYAKTLAKLIPPVAVRLRRDFLAVLQMIKAHAILHQANRNKDEQGRIIATHDDYAVIYELMRDLVSEGVDASVNPNIRDTVKAVAELVEKEDAPDEDGIKYTSGKAVAERLQLDKSAASRRIRAALEAGYIKSLDPGRGKPQKLATAEQLPADIEILPKSSVLQEKCTEENNGCTVASPFGGISGCTVEFDGGLTATKSTKEIEHAPNGSGEGIPQNNRATVQPLPTLSAAELVVLEIAESFESAWFTVGAWAEESEHFGIGVELFNKALVRLIEELEFVEADMSSSPTRFRVVRDGEGDKKTRPFEEECPGCEVCNGKTYPAHPDAIPAGELTWERIVEIEPYFAEIADELEYQKTEAIPYMRESAERDGLDPDAEIRSLAWDVRRETNRVVEVRCAAVPELCSDHARDFIELYLLSDYPGVLPYWLDPARERLGEVSAA